MVVGVIGHLLIPTHLLAAWFAVYAALGEASLRMGLIGLLLVLLVALAWLPCKVPLDELDKSMADGFIANHKRKEM